MVKFCKIEVIGHYHNLEDSIVLENSERRSYVLGVIDVVREDFNPNSDEMLVEVKSTNDSYQVRPKMVKVKKGKLKYGNKTMTEFEEKLAFGILFEINKDEFVRVVKIYD